MSVARTGSLWLTRRWSPATLSNQSPNGAFVLRVIPFEGEDIQASYLHER